MAKRKGNKVPIRSMVVGTGIVVGILAMTVAYYLYTQQAYEDGVARGRHQEQSICIQSVMAGDQVCSERICAIHNRFFFRGCMDVAERSDAVCQEVPRMPNLFGLQSWKNRSCKRYERSDQSCKNIHIRIFSECEIYYGDRPAK